MKSNIEHYNNLARDSAMKIQYYFITTKYTRPNFVYKKIKHAKYKKENGF